MKKKYFTEFLLNSRVIHGLLFAPSDIEDAEKYVEQRPEKFHIYWICRAPRIYIDIASINIKDGNISGRFIIDKGVEKEEINFNSPHRLNIDDKRLSVVSKYPYTTVEIKQDNAEVIFHGKSRFLFAMLCQSHFQKLDLEVVYIGQSYGTDGDREAVDRLYSHSTLQRIMADSIQSAPNQDIWIFTSAFDLDLVTCIEGNGKHGVSSTLDDDSEHVDQVLDSEILNDVLINYVEAALITYFDPLYNDKFKGTFPARSHSSYNQLYDIDFHSLSFELETSAWAFRFWSDKVNASYMHMASYDLHSTQDRESLLSMIGEYRQP